MDHRFRPLVRLWFVLAGLCLLCFALSFLDDSGALPFWNTLVLFMICLSTWTTAYQLLRNDQDLVWTPLFWFLIAYGIYFGFGSMIILFGPEESLEYINSIYPTDQLTLLRINLLNLTGFLITLFSFFISFFFLPTQRNRPFNEDQNIHQAKFLALFFLSAGGSVHYFFILPHFFELIDTPLPGAIANFQLLLYISLVLISYLRLKTNEWLWSALLMVLLPMEAITSFLTYSKQAFLTVPILVGLGSFLAHKNIKKLAVFGAATAVLYFYIKPIVSDARIEHSHYIEQAKLAPFSTRSKVIWRVITKTHTSSQEESDDEIPMAWWARLCYTNVQAFALHEVSLGNTVNTYENWPYVFIPRLLMPDKPVMTDMGTDFTEMINGTRTSSTGLGVYMEGYWNARLVGLFSVAFYIGIVLALLSYQSLLFIRDRKWMYIPLSFMAVQMGMGGPVAWFLPAFVGSLPLYFGYYLIFWFLTKLRLIPG